MYQLMILASESEACNTSRRQRHAVTFTLTHTHIRTCTVRRQATILGSVVRLSVGCLCFWPKLLRAIQKPLFLRLTQPVLRERTGDWSAHQPSGARVVIPARSTTSTLTSPPTPPTLEAALAPRPSATGTSSGPTPSHTPPPPAFPPALLPASNGVASNALPQPWPATAPDSWPQGASILPARCEYTVV